MGGLENGHQMLWSGRKRGKIRHLRGCEKGGGGREAEAVRGEKGRGGGGKEA